ERHFSLFEWAGHESFIPFSPHSFRLRFAHSSQERRPRGQAGAPLSANPVLRGDEPSPAEGLQPAEGEMRGAEARRCDSGAGHPGDEAEGLVSGSQGAMPAAHWDSLRGYIEHQDHVAGRSVIASVNEIIQSSRVALVLLTSRSLADPWCQRVVEWNLVHTILQEGTKVIPVCVDVRQEQMPPALRHLTGLEYRGPFFRQRLLDSVQKARSPTRTPCPSSLTRVGV
uniref:TIR domain-containing protein n=1 Tax=Varanus komodoensis TaxID=61221 RepID=A0A8D2LA32_VARKO